MRNPLSPRSGNRVDEHGSESAMGAVVKKAKGKGKSTKSKNKPATRRRNSKVGALESIMSMPFDIVYEVRERLIEVEHTC